MIFKSPALYFGISTCAAIALGAVIWMQTSRSQVPTQVSTPAMNKMDSVESDIMAKSRKIQMYLAAKTKSAPAKAFVQKSEATGGSEANILAELTGYVACYSDASTCRMAPVKVRPDNVRQTLEHIEARVRLEELSNEEMLGSQILALMELQPQFANTAISLLQEFADSSSLLKAYEVTSLQPENKTKLIEASLDPADETYKDLLHSKARALFTSMMEAGDPSEAFAATSVIRLFRDLSDDDYSRMGQSLCRFNESSNESEMFMYESLKTKLKRNVTDRKHLNSMLSTCKG